jgi:peroxiredoxin
MVNAFGIIDVAFDVCVTLAISPCYYISTGPGGHSQSGPQSVACIALHSNEGTTFPYFVCTLAARATQVRDGRRWAVFLRAGLPNPVGVRCSEYAAPMAEGIGMRNSECRMVEWAARGTSSLFRSSHSAFRIRRTAIALIAIIVLLGWPQPSRAGRFNKVLSVGDAAPAWSDLAGVDGRKHSLADLKAAKAVVVIFTCNHCPVATAYQPRLVRLTKDYAARGVAIVAISVSRDGADTLKKMKARAKEEGYPFPYLQDLSQAIGRRYGATRTPQFFVLDGERKVAYMGALDDDNDAQAAKTHYVRAALDAVLAGKRPAVTETRPRGCEIEWAEDGK